MERSGVEVYLGHQLPVDGTSEEDDPRRVYREKKGRGPQDRDLGFAVLISQSEKEELVRKLRSRDPHPGYQMSGGD